MMTKDQLEQALDNFYGTEQYYRWSFIYPKFVMTDGAKFLADEAEAYWFMDLIGSYQAKLLKWGEFFQVWKIEVKDHSAVVTCTGGHSDIPLVQQEVEYTDFPLDSCKLYAVYDGSFLVIMLPSEY